MKTPAKKKSSAFGAFATASLCLALLSTSSSAAMTDGCVNDTTVIFEHESSVDDPSAGDTRTYILCPDTIFDVGFFNMTTKSYEDGMAGLDLVNPNVHVLCGKDGRRENNCVLEGGQQAYVGASSAAPLTNVLVSGVTFRDSGHGKVVKASAVTDENGVIFRDCVFEDHSDMEAVVDALSTAGDGVNPGDMTLVFDSCTFRNNDAAEWDVMFGLIFNVDHVMKVRNCDFVNNRAIVFDNPEGADTFSFVLGNFDQGDKKGRMEVTGSVFVNNTVSMALVYDELSKTTATNNMAEGNNFFPTKVTDEHCEGLATFTGDTGGLKFDCDPFPATLAPTEAPKEGEPTEAPTVAPKEEEPTAPPSSSPRLAAGQLAIGSLTLGAAVVLGSWS